MLHVDEVGEIILEPWDEDLDDTHERDHDSQVSIEGTHETADDETRGDSQVQNSDPMIER